MLDFGFYNMDCMEGMKKFPDKYFDLAIVDPPYGAGFTEGGGCKGWFSKYHQDPVENSGGGVVLKNTITDSVEGLTGTSKGKKLYRGTLPLGKNTLMNFFAFHEIKLYGVAIILGFHQQDALLFGAS